MQSHALWQSATLAPDHWKGIFYPIADLFPPEWVRPYRWEDTGYVAAALYVLLLAALFGAYIIALRRTFSHGAFRAADSGAALRRIFVFTALALAVLLIVPGALSTDVFSYIWYGRIVEVFGQNPFTHVPRDFAWHDPGNWLQWVYWKETPSVYGPVWV